MDRTHNNGRHLETTYSLVLVSHLLLAPYNAPRGAPPLLPHARLELVFGEWIVALGNKIIKLL